VVSGLFGSSALFRASLGSPVFLASVAVSMSLSWASNLIFSISSFLVMFFV